MPKNKTSITPETRKKLPPRGKNKRTLILEALQAQAFNGLAEDSTPEQAERKWFEHLIATAIDPDNKDAALCLRLVTERGWAALKPVGENVEFSFDRNGSLADQAGQILDAVAGGHLSVEHGKMLVDGIKGLAEIEASTELKIRIAEIEKKLGIEG